MNRSDKAPREPAAPQTLTETLTKILEAAGLGIVYLGAHGRIITPNDLTRRILKEGGISSDMDGRLFIRNREDNRELRRILDRAFPPSGTKGVAGTAFLSRPNGLPSIAIRVVPLRDGESEMHSRPVAAVALIVDPSIVVEIDPALVAAVFGLTPAEANVSALLAQGKNVREIATSTYRTEGTIYRQVKDARGKLGLTRQTELALLVRALGVFP